MEEENVRENNVKNAVCNVAEMKWKVVLLGGKYSDKSVGVETCTGGVGVGRTNDFLRRFFRTNFVVLMRFGISETNPNVVTLPSRGHLDLARNNIYQNVYTERA